MYITGVQPVFSSNGEQKLKKHHTVNPVPATGYLTAGLFAGTAITGAAKKPKAHKALCALSGLSAFCHAAACGMHKHNHHNINNI